MWEAIASNRRRSWVLLGLLGAMLVILGFILGLGIDPEYGGGVGAVFALAVWGGMLALALTAGDSLLLLGANAREIKKQDAPRLWNIVEEMAIASGMGGAMPRIYIVDDPSPNAFAVGLKPESAAIAVTYGLVRRLNRDELQGVVGHELGHIANQDARFMTIATVMVGSIAFLADLFRFMLRWGGIRRGGGRAGGTVQIVILVVAILAAILAPIAAGVLFFACSRRREYLADASSARFTRYPEGLASALEKIALEPRRDADVNRALAPLYIVNPLQGGTGSTAFDSHPPTAERILILRRMAGGCGYVDYEKAYRSTRSGDCIGQASLGVEKSVPSRTALPAEEPNEAIERAREIADVLGRFADFIPIVCACGVRIQVPSGLARETIPCPRCGRENPVPHARAGALRETPVATAEGAPPPPVAPLHFTRSSAGWVSFKCTCGKVIQLSPSFDAAAVTCRGCKRSIRIDGPPSGAAAPRLDRA
jgi:heat shock protein HtpX